MITFVKFEVLPVATVMFTAKMEAEDHYAAFVISRPFCDIVFYILLYIQPEGGF